MEELEKYYQGKSFKAAKIFGSFIENDGVLFRIHAPNACKVFVVGSFNNFKETDELIKKDDQTFELVVKNAKEHDHYLYIIYGKNGGRLEKTDPYAKLYALRPEYYSIVTKSIYTFNDEKWMQKRTNNYNDSLNIYEMHLDSWMHLYNGVSYRNLAVKIIEYIHEMHYTHVEFMPLTEYPFDGSWGYQAFGYFAPTSRYGHMDDLKYLIDELHKENIGVILDYVLVHFVKNDFGLNNFDTTALYENDDSRYSNSEWDSYNFDFSKNNVKSFLLSSVYYFIKEFHFDGIRVDAVSNIIYYQGNKNNGVNSSGVSFIKELNDLIHKEFNNQVMTIAEDSTDYPAVTSRVNNTGLRFDYKWCLGWMNDSLDYFMTDPCLRKDIHHLLTFSMMYNDKERFILPISHDEVVHGKMSIVSKMYGFYEERFAQARAYYAYMYLHPGHKLIFMGDELGQMIEFDETREIDWELLEFPMHQKFHNYMKELNLIYEKNECLSKHNFDNSFEWLNADKKDDNMYMFTRFYGDEEIVFILNASKNYYENYRIGVRISGAYEELINTDNLKYGGFGVQNDIVKAEKILQDGRKDSLSFNIAPLSAIVFKLMKKEY